MNILHLTVLLRQENVALPRHFLRFPWKQTLFFHCSDVEVVTLMEVYHLHREGRRCKVAPVDIGSETDYVPDLGEVWGVLGLGGPQPLRRVVHGVVEEAADLEGGREE